jgi:RNA polymerase sigma-70 factor (ECF subfamily)
VEGALQAHLTVVWRVLRRLGMSAADADDAAQDVFWVFAQRAFEVPPRAERSFLLATALRVASDRRRSAWQRRVTEELDPEHPEASQAAPDVMLERHRRLQLLDAALGMLQEEEREVFVLSEVEELSREESAELLGLPAGTVASRLKRARERFSAAVTKLTGAGGRHYVRR